ncbi:uncharacterized protein LOC124819854 [Vigna umbellata]|uniref:uncharacterized protein LOC124819854 n=1 Tax=Vigna umbellata TaxID=87088 RepID=UPI001F5EDE43|nr:uncharacterized protein LOC124819854 [Vigna umbellata]
MDVVDEICLSARKQLTKASLLKKDLIGVCDELEKEDEKKVDEYLIHLNSKKAIASNEIQYEKLQKEKKTESQKLDDALWAYRTAYKSPTGLSLFQLVYGKSCHLPVELEHKKLWVLKFLNLDSKAAREKRRLQLQEFEEMRFDAYESSKLYKERMKAYHDKKIFKREFYPSQLVLWFNSRLRLFLGKLKSKCSGPFLVKVVKPYGAIELEDLETKRS